MSDPATWHFLLSILTSIGYREIQARAIIGRKLRDWSEQDVCDAFEAAAGKADPVSYASKILNTRPKRVNGQARLAPADTVTSEQSREAYARHRDKLKEKLR